MDKAFNREILELDVKCNQHEWGCKWEGEFQNAKVCEKNVTIDHYLAQQTWFKWKEHWRGPILLKTFPFS